MVEERPEGMWRHMRRALDPWSVPHFIFGILMGFVGPLTGMGGTMTLIVTITVALAWEVGEKIVGIRESIPNIAFDILLPLIALWLTSYLLSAYPLHPDELMLVGSAFLLLYVYTNISGWLAYRRRARDFSH